VVKISALKNVLFLRKQYFTRKMSRQIFFASKCPAKLHRKLNFFLFFPKRKTWQLGKYLIYIQPMELYRMYNSNLLHIDFYVFRFFSSNRTMAAQFTNARVDSMFVFLDRDNEKIWNFHNKLLPLSPVSVQSFKSKFEHQFSSCSWGGPQPSIKKYRKNGISWQQ